MPNINLTAAQTGAQQTKNALSGINVQTNKVFVKSANYDESEGGTSVNITAAIFFDGTRNNKENTQSRLDDEERQQEKLNHLKEKYENGVFNPRYLESTKDGVDINSNKRYYIPKAKPDATPEVTFPNYKPLKTKLSSNDIDSANDYRDPESGVKRYDSTSSYENDFTNVVRLEEFCDDEIEEENHVYLKVYAEGIGTDNGGEDETSSYAVGIGVLGIRNKVLEACELLAEKIIDVDKEEVGELIIDVYGFSRGAAAARHFIHEVQRKKGIKYREPDSYFWGTRTYDCDRGYLGELLEESIKVKKLVIRFAGLYDCVASHGLVQNNDTKDLGLDAIKHANHTFHLAAIDEHRLKFSLTNIDSASTKGVERFLPGAHSDVGGSYLEKSRETVLLSYDTIANKGKKDSIIYTDRNFLIEQGWFKKEELTEERHTIIQRLPRVWKVLKNSLPGGLGKGLLEDYREKMNVLVGNREKLNHYYSFIPLEFMAEQAKNKGLKYFPIGEILSKYDINNGPNSGLLKKTRTRLHSYVFGDEQEMNVHHSKEDREMLEELRNEYFHFSSNYHNVDGIGFIPDWKGNKRARTVFSDMGGEEKRPLQYKEFYYNRKELMRKANEWYEKYKHKGKKVLNDIKEKGYTQPKDGIQTPRVNTKHIR